MNELLTNTLKYAFKAEAELRQRSKIAIVLTQPDEGNICLEVRDNGGGLPQDALSANTLGMRLVHLLAKEQLNGTLEIDTSAGTRYCVVFQRSSNPNTAVPG